MPKKWLPGLLDAGRLYQNPKPWMMRLGLDGLKGLFRVFNLPGIRRFHPWMQESKTNMYWIPVNKELERGQDVPLPYEIVEHFIEKSSTRVVMDFCGCRAAHQCQRFPTDVGCLMMGDDAVKIPPEFSRMVSRDEARAHLQKAVEAGLPPFIGKARIDNFIFGVPDNNRLLTVCFCCDCCCITDMLKHIPHEERQAIVHPVDGLEIYVDGDACVGCGQCAEHCFIEAISLETGKARISGECRGCCRCVSVCPSQAIIIRLDNPDFVQSAVKSIESSVGMD